jgi:zinc finger-like protein
MEQRELVSRFCAAIPVGGLAPVLARGPVAGEQGPLRTLLAQWLATAAAQGAAAPTATAAGAGTGPEGAAKEGGAAEEEGTGSGNVSGAAASPSSPRASRAMQPPAKRQRTTTAAATAAAAAASTGTGTGTGHAAATPRSPSIPPSTEKKAGPIDHIFQFHDALRRELRRLESDVLALPPPEAVAPRAGALRDLEGRFRYLWAGAYTRPLFRTN